eukprot:scaffold11921_cov102-Isochrysis_galbana.AAC.5
MGRPVMGVGPAERLRQALRRGGGSLLKLLKRLSASAFASCLHRNIGRGIRCPVCRGPIRSFHQIPINEPASAHEGGAPRPARARQRSAVKLVKPSLRKLKIAIS